MECRYLHVCVVFAVIFLGGSYGYGYGRRHGHYSEHGYGHGYHREPDQRFYGGIHHQGYGGDMHYPPRQAYIHGSIYNHESEDEHSSSEEEETHESEEHHEEHHDEDHKIWRFKISDNFPPNAYIDDNGHTKGFFIDLLLAVCERAHKTCYYMVDSGDHCWRTDGERERPGIGLLDHFYDGCMGYWQTTARKNSFNFTLPFLQNVRASLHYKAGVTVENSTTVTGKKIGFVSGWPLSKNCFEHQTGFTGNSPGSYEPVLYETHQLMVDALIKGEVDALVTVDIFEDAPLGIQHTDPFFLCTEAGGSVMTMYGSELLDWWNHAFEDMKNDGTFGRLCHSSARRHAAHGEVHCI